MVCHTAIWRPPSARACTRRHCIREYVPVEKLKRVVGQVLNAALKGDMKAAKLILEFFVSKARDSEDAPDQARTYVFKIENATFGALNPQENSNSNVIDVTPVEEQ